MAGLLLLLLSTLATFGSGLSASGDSSGHNLALDKSTICEDAEDNWTVAQFEACAGNRIAINHGKGTIDVSKWEEDKVVKIFANNLDGGFTIRNSEFIGKDIIFNMELIKAEDATLTVASNSKLTNFFLVFTSKTKHAPRVRVSGNRLLNEDSIESLEEHLEAGTIRADSHIQIYGECDLENTPVDDVATILKDCKAIYGDLIFDANSKFPADEAGMKSIEKLVYVQGCLRITGTKLKSWKDLTFLDGTTSKKGGCTAGHEISGNPNMCIHPPMAEILKKAFPGMTIVSNQPCKPECTSRHVLEKADSTCEIITDSLVIGPTTTVEGLKALKNVAEIQGLLQLTNTPITDFNYLPALTKLNTKNMSAGPVIKLQFNKQMMRFDLPQLQASGVGMGRGGQTKFWTDKNGPDGKYTGEEAFIERIGAKDSQMAVPPPAVPTTTQEAVTTVRPNSLVDSLGSNMALFICGGFGVFFLFTVPTTLFVLFYSGIWNIPHKWKSLPMGEIFEQTGGYQYHQDDNKHMKEARKIIEDNKLLIEVANQRHLDNTDYKILSVLNHNATSRMPGYFQWKDYEKNKKLRNHERKECRKRNEEERAAYEKNKTDSQKKMPAVSDEEKKKIISTLTLPAEVSGLYGLAFEAETHGVYPAAREFRTQCDQYSLNWFGNDLLPIYVEKFASTAKRMCHTPCDAISENLRYLRDKSTKIPEYGITSKGFQTKTGTFGDEVAPRCVEDKKNLVWIIDQVPIYKFYRYREKLNELGTVKNLKKYKFRGKWNLDEYVIRMVEMMMSMPVGHQLKLEDKDVLHFLRVIFPSVIGKAKGYNKKYKRGSMAAGGYSVDLNRTHVRIVGELRGDFDALRRAMNIPSLLTGEDHPMLQYNWVFLGNYTGRHPQSVETIMFLLALQFLYGRESIVLLRGVMEFTNTSEEYGFKENLIKRFGKKGKELHEHFMKIFARLPLNCCVLRSVCCSSGGFNDEDILGEDLGVPWGGFKAKTTTQSLNKIFSLPNYTVRDYFENVDTGAGYYYGERVLEKIATDCRWYTFFSTGPMKGGVGYFCETPAVQLFMLSSVKGLRGHGGMVTQLPAVAELNGQTGRVTFHMMLEEDQMFYYDQELMEFRNTPFGEEEDGKKKTTTTSTAGPSASATSTGGPSASVTSTARPSASATAATPGTSASATGTSKKASTASPNV